mmetsp:Transcript_20487/g.27800  ORF Transcript_20487/g.27800 Transcript_20487/m.27800 type:complete len:84 (+) Transcript_20487:223-474(+)
MKSKKGVYMNLTTVFENRGRQDILKAESGLDTPQICNQEPQLKDNRNLCSLFHVIPEELLPSGWFIFVKCPLQSCATLVIAAL